MVYGIGGEEAVAGQNNPRKQVFRYDRMDNEWTEVESVPVAKGGSDPNCIKVQFRGREVILFFGATFEGGQMFAFDLETEKWEDTGVTAPVPPHFDSLLFVTGDLLYRQVTQHFIHYITSHPINQFRARLHHVISDT